METLKQYIDKQIPQNFISGDVLINLPYCVTHYNRTFTNLNKRRPIEVVVKRGQSPFLTHYYIHTDQGAEWVSNQSIVIE